MNSFESEEIRHQIYLEQYKTGQANRIIGLLDQADRQIARFIRQTDGVYTKARYREIARKLREISKSLRESVEDGTDIDGIIGYELKKQEKLLDELKDSVKKISASPVNSADFLFPSAEQIKTAALFKPVVEGMTFQSYLEGIESGLYNVWDSAVRTGYLTGMTTDRIVREVLGSAAGNSRLAESGAIRAFRNSVYNNTRTVLQSFANETRKKVFEENEQYFGDSSGYKYEYLATLDRRTCAVCGSYDGKRYRSLKEAPEIPVHYSCRCMVIPAIDIEGDTRAAEGGAVDAKITYEDWLRSQPEKVQRDVLGASRFRLFMTGQPVTSFVSGGKTLTLDELKEKIDIKANTRKEI